VGEQMGSEEETGSHIFAAELDIIYLKMESVVKISKLFVSFCPDPLNSSKTHLWEKFNDIIDLS
jgi:hypothetical protein